MLSKNQLTVKSDVEAPQQNCPDQQPQVCLLRNQHPWLAPGMTTLLQAESQAWLPSPLRRSARFSAMPAPSVIASPNGSTATSLSSSSKRRRARSRPILLQRQGHEREPSPPAARSLWRAAQFSGWSPFHPDPSPHRRVSVDPRGDGAP